MSNSYTNYFLKQHPDRVRAALKIIEEIDQWSVDDMQLAIKLHGNKDTKKMLHEVLSWKVKKI